AWAGQRFAPPTPTISSLERGFHLYEELSCRVFRRLGAVAELLAQLAELTLKRAVGLDRHGRSVAETVGDRCLVVAHLGAQLVEVCTVELRLRNRQATV